MKYPHQHRLSRMVQVTDAAMEAALADLRESVQTRKDVEAQIADLDRDRRRMAQTAEDASSRAGVSLLWHRWAETRRAQLNAALARSRVRENDRRALAATAFGRNQVMVGIVDKAKSGAGPKT